MTNPTRQRYETTFGDMVRGSDPVEHPAHYTSHPYRCECGRGIECADISEHFDHPRAAALEYIWRAGLKGDKAEDLRKAIWWLQRAIQIEERRRG